MLLNVYEIERDARLVYRIRATSVQEAEQRALVINEIVGTFMVNTGNWRFKPVGQDGTDRIVEIYAEEG